MLSIIPIAIQYSLYRGISVISTDVKLDMSCALSNRSQTNGGYLLRIKENVINSKVNP